MSNPSARPDLDSSLAALEPGFLAGAGRFTLSRCLGRGGMGVVWLARDEALREDVALKFLPPEIRFDAVALDDLRRETSRSRKLTHPNIIRIHDLFRDEREAFLSMEYVDGPNLSDLRIQQGDRVFSWSFLEPLVKQLCDALAYAHDEGVVHRDLKPANMMLDRRGRLKLADFGIAAVVSDSVSRLSLRHATSGTVTHMSPQQMDGHTPQVSDDIYALGATLYELLTSRPPFYLGDIPHQVRNIAAMPLLERLEEFDLENDVPPAVAAMVMACLSKDPARRPANARVVAEWLGLQPVTRVTEAPVPPANVSPPAAVAEAPPAEAANLPIPRNYRVVPSLLVLSVVVLLSLSAWWFWPRHAGLPGVVASNTPPATAAGPSPISAADGWVTIFNGRDLSGWAGDMRLWSVEEGAICGRLERRTRANEPSALFWRGPVPENFELRFLFRLAHAGNSGVYYRATELPQFDVGGYQFEIGSGGPGNLMEVGNDRRRRDLKRVRNAAGRTDRWCEGQITVVGHRISHAINGQVLFELDDTAASAPSRGAVALELTGGPTTVFFKDIRLRKVASQPAAAADGGWIPLFDGTSLDAWEGAGGASWNRSWSSANGELTSLPGAAVNLVTRDTFANFELEFEWKVTPRANSGVLYRAPDTAGSGVWQLAPEYQVVDDALHPDGRLAITSAGSLFGIAGTSTKALRRAGEFNRGRIVVRGRHIEHWLNGLKTADVDLSDPAVQRQAFTRFRKAMWGEAAGGRIVLQHLGQPVSFRNIRVRRLPDS